MLIWLAVALAADPDVVPEVLAPEPPVEAPAEPEAGVVTVTTDASGEEVHELIVYGDLRVAQAIDAVVEGFQDEGFTEVVDKGDYLRLRSDAPWKGEVRVYKDGWIRTRRQPVRVVAPEVPWAPDDSPGAYATCILWPPACVKVGGVLVSRRKLRGVQVRAIAGVQDEIEELGDTVADREVEKVVNDLPYRLERLWRDGTPLFDEGHYATPADRKAAILDYWESRTDTVWGDHVRLAVEAFIREEIQYSDHPYTPEEVASFNETRHCERVLDLDRPWPDVVAEVEPLY